MSGTSDDRLLFELALPGERLHSWPFLPTINIPESASDPSGSLRPSLDSTHSALSACGNSAQCRSVHQENYPLPRPTELPESSKSTSKTGQSRDPAMHATEWIRPPTRHEYLHTVYQDVPATHPYEHVHFNSISSANPIESHGVTTIERPVYTLAEALELNPPEIYDHSIIEGPSLWQEFKRRVVSQAHKQRLNSDARTPTMDKIKTVNKWQDKSCPRSMHQPHRTTRQDTSQISEPFHVRHIAGVGSQLADFDGTGPTERPDRPRLSDRKTCRQGVESYSIRPGLCKRLSIRESLGPAFAESIEEALPMWEITTSSDLPSSRSDPDQRLPRPVGPSLTGTVGALDDL